MWRVKEAYLRAMLNEFGDVISLDSACLVCTVIDTFTFDYNRIECKSILCSTSTNADHKVSLSTAANKKKTCEFQNFESSYIYYQDRLPFPAL